MPSVLIAAYAQTATHSTTDLDGMTNRAVVIAITVLTLIFMLGLTRRETLVNVGQA